ncbi:hypothetical protein LSAT2_011323 [Lamellibrachia satsuma]|nr:hypothetical protein LSAT2_011323 [Lamellibrachia satsuma]
MKWLVLLSQNNIALERSTLIVVSSGIGEARRKQLSRNQEGSDGGTCCTVVYLKKLLVPFLHTYDLCMQTVKNIKQAWRTSVSGCNMAQSLLEEIFGPKVNEKFPKNFE